METIGTLELAKARVQELGWQNVAVVYSYTGHRDGRTYYAIFQRWSAADMWRNDTRLDVEVVYTAAEGWIDEG